MFDLSLKAASTSPEKTPWFPGSSLFLDALILFFFFFNVNYRRKDQDSIKLKGREKKYTQKGKKTKGIGYCRQAMSLASTSFYKLFLEFL